MVTGNYKAQQPTVGRTQPASPDAQQKSIISTPRTTQDTAQKQQSRPPDFDSPRILLPTPIMIDSTLYQSTRQVKSILWRTQESTVVRHEQRRERDPERTRRGEHKQATFRGDAVGAPACLPATFISLSLFLFRNPCAARFHDIA